MHDTKSKREQRRKEVSPRHVENSARPSGASITIEQWFVDQDKAVEAVYVRLCKGKRGVIASKGPGKRNGSSKSLTCHLIARIEESQKYRRDFAHSFKNLDIDEVGRIIQRLEQMNEIAVRLFEAGQFDTKNHEINVVREIVNGNLLSRIVCDGLGIL